MAKYYKIIICKNCEGNGYKTRHNITDYHRNEYDVEKFVCGHCGGKGRIREITEITYEKLTDITLD